MDGRWTIDVGALDFDENVVAASASQPILVDFWASWCGPCRVLGPILEALAEEYDGAFTLAKVDTQAHPELAERFGIRGIPAVKLFIGGAIVDEFVGALGEPKIREFLSRHVRSELDEALTQAAEKRRSGALQEAAAILAGAPAGTESDPRRMLEQARLAFAQGRFEEIAATEEAIDFRVDEKEAAQALRRAAELAVKGAGIEDLEAAERELASAKGDHDARYALACAFFAAGRVREALEHFLAIVASDRTFRDDGARKAMVTVFEVSEDPEMVREFRRKLTIIT